DPLVSREVRITAPRVTCELNKDGLSNVEVIRKAVEGQRRHGGEETPPGPEGQPLPPETRPDDSSARRLIIDLFAINDGEVYVDARAVGGPAQSEKLPGFELTDIRPRQGGATPNEVGRIIVTALARDVAVAVAATQLERWIGKELGGTAGDLIKKGGAQAIRKGLGDVLDQILKKQQ